MRMSLSGSIRNREKEKKTKTEELGHKRGRREL